MSDQPPSTYPDQPYPPQQQAQGQNPYGFQQPQQRSWTPPPVPARDPNQRPGTVLAASIITIASSVIALLGTGLALVALLVARADMMDEIRDEPGLDGSGIDADTLYNVIIVVLIVFVVWCLISTMLGFWALRRSNTARVLLTISAAMTALISLVAIMSLISVVPLLAAIAVLVLLYVGGANEWYARR